MSECKGQHQQCSECWEWNQDRICELETEVERLREDMLEIATLVGIAGPTPAILRRIADLVRREQGGRP
jgi:hypothetical protein